MNDKIIKPGCPAGVRDLLPVQAAQRRDIVNRVISVYEMFGFVPLETSMLEREEILTGGDPNFTKKIFRIKDPSKNRDPLALRFDLTVPLARVIAQYPELPRPFKRWQMGRAFRGEKPQAGRYREFAQLDADTVGTPNLLADIEIINMIYLVMQELNIRNFMIRVNTRQILNALPFYAGFDPAKIIVVLRILDKLDKIGLEGVKEELSLQSVSEWDNSPGLSNDIIAKLVRFLQIQGSNEEVQLQIGELMGSIPEASQGIRDLQEIVRGVEAAGVDSKSWALDLSVARGLGYYTGPVFETLLTDLPEFGSVCSGGRYDGLVNRFSKQNIPATGASVGIDRLFTAMEKLDLLNEDSVIKPRVVVIYPDEELRFEAVKAATELRQTGLRTELYMGTETSIGGQIGYSANRGAQFVVIIGLQEFAAGQVAIKNLDTRQQEMVDRNQMCAKIMAS